MNFVISNIFTNPIWRARNFIIYMGCAEWTTSPLVLNLKNEGKINSGRELFGNHTLLKNGKEAANGFEALAELDDNSDGVVDANDATFSSLKVWKDANGNGITDEGELLTLGQAGIKSFNVSYTSSDSTDANGNQHLQHVGRGTRLNSFEKTSLVFKSQVS